MRSPRTSLIRVTAGALHKSGLLRLLPRAVGRLRRPPAFPILTYHRVNDEHDPFFESLPTSVFEKQMDHVAHCYRVLTVEELVARARSGSLPPNALGITFDDGYRDSLTHAAPILARLGLPATIFLTTGLIGTAHVAWTDRLALAFKTTSAPALRAPWGHTVPLGSPADRLRALGQTLAYFKRQPDREMGASLDQLLKTLGGTDQRGFKDLMLSWDDVAALTGLGFSIGAHTVNHPILSRVSPDRVWIEIEGSRVMIETVCGRSPRAFAYPNGRAEDYTAVVVRLVQDAGFSCAVTTRFGVNTATTPPFELRRGGPWEHDLPVFALKLAGYRLLPDIG